MINIAKIVKSDIKNVVELQQIFQTKVIIVFKKTRGETPHFDKRSKENSVFLPFFLASFHVLEDNRECRKNIKESL